MSISRRDFIKNISIVTIGLTSFSRLLSSTSILLSPSSLSLIKDPKGVLNLPEKFSYSILSKLNDKMDDGLNVPDKADGMGCFKIDDNHVVLVRNHEIGHIPLLGNAFRLKNPYGKKMKRYIKKKSNYFYDSSLNKTECFGGTTSLTYNIKTKKVINQHLSLAGTLVNCSGGKTPWGTWISCEETVKSKEGKILKNHGYNFEVFPSSKNKLTKAIPLKEMGRFRHEAVAFDIKKGHVYQTEDREDGLFYRFIPKVKNNLKKGGKLQALSLSDFRKPDCRNWKNETFKVGKSYQCEWIDLNEVESPQDDLRKRGRSKGCAIFARGEGMWYADDYVYFVATTGGKNKYGQIWRYLNNKIELFYESKNKKTMHKPDNITIAPWGDVIICEDGRGHDRLIGIKPDGKTYVLAENILNTSELAGIVFSPDEKILFLNIYKPTMTLAIEGPWNQL
tara:strand:+ start:1329 stop:2675 length:1347 start_codon:yes stop_codon:yes gene_type:complete